MNNSINKAISLTLMLLTAIVMLSAVLNQAMGFSERLGLIIINGFLFFLNSFLFFERV